MFYKIAECVTECTPMYAMAKERMKPYEAEDGKEDFKIGFSEEFLRQRQSENPHLTQEQCEYIYLTDRFYKKLLLHGGMMLHASAVTVDDRAYLFSAKSGTGKSTHTKQWQKLFGSHRAEILNDDKPALRRTEDGWFAYGTPFSGKTDENQNKKVRLQGICMLERGVENHIERMDAACAIPLLMRQTILPRNEEMAGNLMQMLDWLLREAPVWRMQCNISTEAAAMAYHAMRAESELRE